MSAYYTIELEERGELDRHWSPEGAKIFRQAGETTGFDTSLLFLFLHGVVSACWGAALCVFALVQVPIAWTISQAGINNPAFTNTLVAFVATISTLHITYVLQRVVEEYSKYLLLSGFTLDQLTWLQGVKDMSLFTRFPAREGGGCFQSWPKKRLLWLVIDAGFAVHASSLVSILQPREYTFSNQKNTLSTYFSQISPDIFFKHVYFNNPIPCGNSLGNMTLGVDPFLNDTQQQFIDTLSFEIGIQLANYGGEERLSYPNGLIPLTSVQ